MSSMRRRTGASPDASCNRDPSAARPRRDMAVPLILQAVAMVGLAALLYSSAADWFAVRAQSATISGYIEQAATLPTSEQQAALATAAAYNADLPEGVLSDPYSAPLQGHSASGGTAYGEYTGLLKVEGTEAIGQVTYPRLQISMPIYHGTSEKVISRGAGHLYGSSLPIGGVPTHSVLTAHSGLVHASLFTRLPKAHVGDTFQIEVLGEVRHYRVTDLQTVLPDDIESLQIEADRDLVTLMTCTPIGINSHRLLVHAERIDGPSKGAVPVLATGTGVSAGFPWWVVVFVGGSVLAAVFLFLPLRRGSMSHAPQASRAPEVS